MPRPSLTLRAAAVLAAVTLGATLAACADTTRIPPAPTDTGAAEPLFASDEEALAAAVEAYEEFLAVSDLILRDGGGQPERLQALVSESLYESEVEGFDAFAAAGLTQVGESRITGAELQQRSIEPALGQEHVIVYVCVSVEDTDVVDAGGESVVSSEGPGLALFEAEIVYSADGFVIESKSFWGGAEWCG